MKTLLLDQVSWDLVIDATSNIAVASNPYALAQDAASEIKTFLGEVYYDTTHGVPYFSTILGLAPPLSYVKKQWNAAALLVPEVVAAQTFISSFENREIKGQVQVTDREGAIMAATF
jgi:hypothetical protein